jgi:glutamine cyclotransferase
MMEEMPKMVYNKRRIIGEEFVELQRECLRNHSVLIYASAVTKDGRSIIFCGDTLSGKTTNAIKYAKKGWRILGDDFVLLKDGYIFKTFLEPMHMKNTKDIEIPLKKIPLHYFYRVVRLFTNRKPYIFMTPEELGLKTAEKAKIDKVIFLSNLEGATAAEKIFNVTKKKGNFYLDKRKDTQHLLDLMFRIIRENINESAVDKSVSNVL